MKTQATIPPVLVILLTLALATASAFPQENASTGGSAKSVGSDLDEYFNMVVARAQFVSLGACLIKGDDIVWRGTYGYADREADRKLEPGNIFQLASLSKVVTATALMQLYERSLFGMDDDVNKYISISVRNPNFPDKPITFRMLLTHRAGFADVMSNGNKFSLGVRGDSPIPLTEFVEQVFTPGGKYYSAEYFSKNEPGTRYEYSNMGFWLIGYLVEKIAKEDFSEYCKKNIFKPMGMANTGWHLRDLDTSKMVYGYMGSDTGPNAVQSDSIFFRKVNHFGVPGYPEGMLRTTMQDFSRFVSAFMNKGNYKGYQMLKPETVELMLAPGHVPGIPSRTGKALDIGLTWLLEGTGDEQACTMNGFSGSIFTDVHFWPKEKAAIIFYFTGIRMKTMPAVMDITKKLTTTVKTVRPS